MAGRTLEEYFVALGIKGQNVVLKNIDNVKKKAESLSKTKPVQLKAKAGVFGGVVGNNIIPPQQPGTSQSQPLSPEQKKENKKLIEGINKFANGSKEFVKGVAHFDPVSAVQQAITSSGSAISAMVKAIPVVGDYLQGLPKGLAEISNAMVGMAASAVEIAKSSAATQYAITNRNATTKYYGGDKSAIGQSNLSNAQYSELIMNIAGSFGKIQKPMQGILNELVKSKNTDALSRVASGNWASTGTDKGWMLQQISNETAGLPPSIAQAIQTALLKSNKDLIQGKGAESAAQGINAKWVNQAESQNAEIFNQTSKRFDDLYNLSNKFNNMQMKMIDSGVNMAGAVDKAANAISKLPEIINKVNDAVSHSPGAARKFFESMGIGK